MALGRVLATKVVLRPVGCKKSAAQVDNKWDFLFHQSGMIGSAVVFANADCGHALESFPDARNLSKTFAVTFVSTPVETPEPAESALEKKAVWLKRA